MNAYNSYSRNNQEIENTNTVRLGLPKGRMEKGVLSLLNGAGISVSATERTYRPRLSLDAFETKTLKPHDIVEMLAIGSRDVGFAGADWVKELNVELVELLDTGLDPVRLVAAAPSALLVDGKLPDRQLFLASEYELISKEWIAKKQLKATFVHSRGSTEVFPPEDADCIIDNAASGATLKANGLVVIDEIMRSSTRLFANPRALENPVKREEIERLVLLLRSVLDARERVMLELNVSAENLEQVIAVLPCMREPTISSLHGEKAYALKAAVPKKSLTEVIPQIKQMGGTDIVVTAISQLIA
jgi:ATP phosphoribosyltransferase